jgi:amino acid transporter
MTITYAGICAALIRLRRTRPAADALRIPFGTVLAIVGIALCAVLLTQLGVRHALLMLLTASLAAANGLWATHQTRHGRWRASEAL